MHPPASTCFHLRPPASTCVHLHPPASTYVQLCLPMSTCVHLGQPAFTCVHLRPSVSTCIHLRISASTFIHLHPLLSTCIHMCPPASHASNYIHFCPPASGNLIIWSYQRCVLATFANFCQSLGKFQPIATTFCIFWQIIFSFGTFKHSIVIVLKFWQCFDNIWQIWAICNCL